MEQAVKKQIDVTRLLADLTAAKVELLSAQCAADRIRLQYSPQEVAKFGDVQILKRLIDSADSIHMFLSQIKKQLKQEHDTPRTSK
jgi:hypothetical protein